MIQKALANLPPRVVISGYYGFDNLGDELILRVLTDALKAWGMKVTVLSANPRQTAERYGVDAIHRLAIVDITDVLSQSQLFISGGGGLFQDATGPASPLYYGGLIRLAAFMEVPVAFWGQGVGPLNSAWARKLTTAALKQCTAVSVRDEQSAALVEELAGFVPEVTADPVWLLQLPKQKDEIKNDIFQLGISLRPWGDLTPERLRALARCIVRLLADRPGDAEMVLLPFQASEDRSLLADFEILLRTEGFSGVITTAPPESVIESLTACHALIGMRFHSLVLALLARVPVYGLSYDPKVESLLAQFRLPSLPATALESIDPQTVGLALENCPTPDLGFLQERARRNIEILKRIPSPPPAE